MVRKRQDIKKYVNLSEVVLYSIIGILLVAVVIFGYNWYNINYGSSYKKAIESELMDKCKTPPGYTYEAWREHISHHPDRYRECL